MALNRKPTAARLAFLRAVKAGEVCYWPRRDGEPWSSWWQTKGQELCVTDRCNKAREAGWIATVGPPGRSEYARRRWELTEAGQSVLESAAKR